jgi:hypothetical protein
MIEEWDRDAQEKLLRYCARPPFALDRLARWDDEHLVYNFQRTMPDGRTCQVFDPMELLKRLAELIPPPWMYPRAPQKTRNLVRYHGVLAPNAKLRDRVVELAGPSEELRLRLQEAMQKMGLEEQPAAKTDEYDQEVPAAKKSNKAVISWALLMARIFEFLPLQCPRCQNPMRIVGFIMETMSVQKVLKYLELPSEAPTSHPPRAPPLTIL